MARTTATEAAQLEAALLAAGRDPDLAFDIWDIWQRSGIRAALSELEKQPMTTDTIRTPGEIDADLSDYADADLQRVIERAGALPAARWEHLSSEQRTAQRALNMLVGRQQARQSATDARILEQRAAANRATFDAQRANRQLHDKLSSGIYDL